jgi:outer membrane protein OmpA-like peptidoglycan-associated protein
MLCRHWLSSIVVAGVVAVVGASAAEAAPQATVTPNPHDFGAVRLGTPITQVFSIENTGNPSLTVSSLTFMGTSATDFLVAVDGVTGIAIAPGGTASFTIAFTPSAAGARSATLVVASNAATVNVPLTGIGGSAVIAVTDLDFGVVANSSTSGNGSITVSNSVTTNQAPLHVTSATIAGGSWFTFDTNGAASCAGATSCTFNTDVPPALTVGLRCRPPANATGSQTATVTFTSNTDSGGDSVANLSCTAGPPIINVVTTAVAFGNVPVNPMTPPSMTVTIGNTGGAGSAALSFTVTKSPNLAVYTLGGCATTSCSVAPGAQTSFTVSFAPTAPAVTTIDLVLTTNDPVTANVTIPVSGTGTAPQISTPPPIDFANVEVGKTSGSQDLTVTNTGTAPLTISNAGLTSGGADYMVLTGTTGTQMTVVPPMGTATWTLVCTPSAQGSRSGTFQIVSNSIMQSMLDVPLSCNGQRGNLTVSPTSIAFATVTQGAVSTQTVTLSNTGNIAVNNITATFNPAAVGYSIDPAGNPVPTSLAAGASVVITVRFAPQNATDGGAATLTFAGGWGTTPTPTSAVVSLSGTVRTAGIDLTATTLDFGNLRFDTTVDKTFCIANPYQADVMITAISIAPGTGTMTGEFAVTRIRRQTTCGTGTTSATLPATLTTGQLLEVTVRADPANRIGLMQATLTVNSNLPSNPTRTLALTGVSTTGMLSLTPGPLVDFGPVDVQAAAATQTITITNTGDGPLDLSNFQRTANPRITFTLPGATTLAPTLSLPIMVTYKPTTAAPVGSEETITLTHSIAGAIAGPAMQMIMIRGRGIDRVLDLAPAPTFPDTFRNPGDAAPVRAVRIQNLGEATLKLTAVMLTGATDVWQLVDGAPIDLPQGTSHEFLVRFAPTKAGLAPAAKLQIVHDDDMKPMVSVDLTGRGLDRSVLFRPDTIRIGYTGVGVPFTLDGALLVASGDTKNTFTIRSIELDEGSPFTIEGQTSGIELSPLGERKFAVTFTPEAEGPFTTKARLYLDMDPEAQHEITIEGTAVFVDAHGGGGCAAGGAGGPAGGSVLALAALAGLRRRRRRSIPAAAAALPAAAAAASIALALAPAAASADDLALSVFDPAPATASNGFQLQSPDVGASGDWALSAVLSHATDPLILDGSANGELINDYAVISRSTGMSLGAAFAFLGRFEAGARMPLYMQDGQPAGDPQMQFTSTPAQGTARGDLTLHAKARLLHKRLEGDGAISAGLGAQLTLPTATRDRFTGVEDPSGRVQLLGALTPGAFERRVTVTMNVGGLLRARSSYANLEQKSGVAWGLGLDVRTLDALWLAAEVYGDTVPGGRTDAMTQSRVLSPIEWLGGLRWRPERRVTVGLAAGRGLTSAVGTPAFRGVLSLTLTPGAPELGPIRVPKPDGDADGDGVRDSVDRCPSEPEDKDLYDDTDGCPDPDNDGDGVADAADRCPIDAEDRDGFMDDDGCPDKDTDGDGIADAQDRCPTQAETINGNQDDDGCPDKGDSLVVLSPDRLELLEAIQFTPAQKIAKASTNLLAQIGATLRARSEIVRLRITVHVQPTGDDAKDQELSDKRATAIRDWLVAWGVGPARLEARGFGGTRPLVPPDRKGAAALNQRVELIILERK